MVRENRLVPAAIPHWHFLHEKIVARFRLGKEKVDVRSWTSLRVGNAAAAREMMAGELAADLKDHRYAIDVKADDQAAVYNLRVAPALPLGNHRAVLERHFLSVTECFNPTCDDWETNVRSDGMSLDPKKRPKPDMKQPRLS
jgi:hypothetical protein